MFSITRIYKFESEAESFLSISVFIFYVSFTTFFSSSNEISIMKNPFWTTLSFGYRIFSISSKSASFWIQTLNRPGFTSFIFVRIVLSTFIRLRTASWFSSIMSGCFIAYTSFVDSRFVTTDTCFIDSRFKVWFVIRNSFCC